LDLYGTYDVFGVQKLNISECLERNVSWAEVNAFDTSLLGVASAQLLRSNMTAFLQNQANNADFPTGASNLDLSRLTKCNPDDRSLQTILYKVYRLISCVDIVALTTDPNTQIQLVKQLSVLVYNVVFSVRGSPVPR